MSKRIEDYPEEQREAVRAKRAAQQQKWRGKNKEKNSAYMKAYLAEYAPKYWEEKGEDILAKRRIQYAAEHAADDFENCTNAITLMEYEGGVIYRKPVKPPTELQKAKIQARNRERYKRDRENILARARKFRLKPEARIKERERARKYRKSMTPGAIKLRIAISLRGRIADFIKGKGKSKKARELLGCSLDDFKARIESKFKDGMTWANRGNGHGKWNLDHIRPVASFDLSDPMQQAICFNYKIFSLYGGFTIWKKDTR
jgi:hypothetical protein